ncbi:MAG: cysteine--tRNA ligase [Flavobacteriales bacterium]|nr:cysteine--tRNA ligase [Flavobacteriales bacterium]
MKNQLSIYNTLTKKKEVFEPVNPPFVGMYVCGPTVYNDVHIGNCRTFISFDIVYRYLLYLGYKVRYVRNITDAGHLENDADDGEDKISKQAKLENVEPMEIAAKYANGFHNIMKQFNALEPSIEPLATGHIIEQISMVQKIMDQGFAYEVNGSIYFDVQKYNETNDYGILSGRKIEDLLTGQRSLDGQDDKRNSCDFALWKKASDAHIMRWDSPWGEGFPGWHLECSVMGSKYLGSPFDLHGGGMDLKFPHHECEIAQSVAGVGEELSKYWMHTNMLTINGQRMGKSVGNSLLPEELFNGDNQLMDRGYDPMVVRFFMMQTHYASTLDFSNEALQAAEKGFGKLMKGMQLLNSLPTSDASSQSAEELKAKCDAAMNDDINTPGVIANLFDGVRFINSVNDGKATITKEDLEILQKLYNDYVFDVLGLETIEAESSSDSMDDVLDIIISIRQQAKESKDYATADLIRDKLSAINISLKDEKGNVSWSYNE